MTYRIYLLSYKTEFLKYKAVGMVEPIDLDDDFALRRAIWRLGTPPNSPSVTACVPKNFKIPCDRVLALAMKRNPTPSPRSDPKEKGHVSNKVYEIPCDRVLTSVMKQIN